MIIKSGPHAFRTCAQTTPRNQRAHSHPRLRVVCRGRTAATIDVASRMRFANSPPLQRHGNHPLPHPHRDGLTPIHIRTGTGLAPAHTRTGTGLAPAHICAGTGLAPAHIRTGTGLAPAAHICAGTDAPLIGALVRVLGDKLVDQVPLRPHDLRTRGGAAVPPHADARAHPCKPAAMRRGCDGL